MTADTLERAEERSTYCGSELSSMGWIGYPSNGAWTFHDAGASGKFNLIHL